MNQNFYTEYNVSPVKAKRKLKISPIAAGIIFFLGVVLVVFISGGFSGAGEKRSLNGSILYVVVVDEKNSKTEAEYSSESIKNKGGAGYILTDDVFKICAFVYYAQADAEVVLKRLSVFPQYVCSIKQLKIKKHNEGKTSPELKNALLAVSDYYFEIYDLVLKLDQDEVSEPQALTEVLKIKNSFLKVSEELDKKQGRTRAEELFLSEVETITQSFNSFFGYYGNAVGVSSRLKYFCFELVILYKNVTALLS